MIASLESETPQNAERGIETGIPFEVDSRISTDKRGYGTSAFCAESRWFGALGNYKFLMQCLAAIIWRVSQALVKRKGPGFLIRIWPYFSVTPSVVARRPPVRDESVSSRDCPKDPVATAEAGLDERAESVPVYLPRLLSRQRKRASE